MSEQIYTYRNSWFNLNQAFNYTLLLQIGTDSFSYAITGNKQLLAWDANCSLIELIDPQELAGPLSANYSQTIIGLPANGFTLLPTRLFNKDHLAEFARFLDVKAGERVLTQKLDDENILIYKVDEKTLSVIQKFASANTVYLYEGWIKAIAKNNPLDNELYLDIKNGKAGFLYFKDGRIRFYNSFEIKSEDDLAYYAALVTKELQLDPENTQLKLSGNIQPKDKYSNRLALFFPQTVFNNLQILELPEQLSSSQLLTLAALSLCGSSEAL